MASRLSSLAFSALALCFLCFAVLSNASDTPRLYPRARRDLLLPRRLITETPDNTNVTDHKDTPFTEFRGCGDRKEQVTQAWWDVVELVRLAAGTDFHKPPGTLESRVFGYDVDKREGAAGFVHMVYANILELYTSKIYGKIRISCEDVYQDHAAPWQKQTSCADVVSHKVDGGTLGAYAFSYGQKLEDSTIVLCDTFFDWHRRPLQTRVQQLRDDPADQKDTKEMDGRFRTLLHELTHLAPFAEASEMVVRDQALRPEANVPQTVYGPQMVQRMGMHTKLSVRDRSQNNADSYAMYAIWKYFEALFGTPDASDVPREGDDDSTEPAINSTLSCAPTDTNGPVLGRDNISGAGIDEWCDSLDGQTISHSDARKEKTKSFGSATPGTKLTDLVFSANWDSGVQGAGCPAGDRTTKAALCKIAMYEVLDVCGMMDMLRKDKPRYGGSQQDVEQCVVYKIELNDMGTQTRKRGQARG